MSNIEAIGRELRERISARLLGLDKKVRCCPICWRWHQNGKYLERAVRWPEYWHYEKCQDCAVKETLGS